MDRAQGHFIFLNRNDLVNEFSSLCGADELRADSNRFANYLVLTVEILS
ncbi:MAG: hypothetical protein QM500_07915 [Methylococcales bacterium]